MMPWYYPACGPPRAVARFRNSYLSLISPRPTKAGLFSFCDDLKRPRRLLPETDEAARRGFFLEGKGGRGCGKATTGARTGAMAIPGETSVPPSAYPKHSAHFRPASKRARGFFRGGASRGSCPLLLIGRRRRPILPRERNNPRRADQPRRSLTSWRNDVRQKDHPISSPKKSIINSRAFYFATE